MVQKLRKGLSTYKIELIIFALYFFFLFYLRNLFPFDYSLNLNGEELDWEFYYMMASDPAVIFNKKIIPPFCYRILVPFLVSTLPFDIAFSFNLIAFISFYLLGIIFYFTLRIHFNKVYSVIGFMFLWIIMLAARDFVEDAFTFGYTVEASTLFFFICCFYAILKQNKKLYAIFLFFGVLTKENILFTIPVFFLYTYYIEFEKINYRNGINTIYKNLKYIIPAIAIILFLRLIVIPSTIQEYTYYYELACHGEDYLSLEFITARIKYHLNHLYNFILNITFFAWSFLLIFCFSNNKKNLYNWFKIYGVFILFTFLQVIIAWGGARLIQIAYYPVLFLEVLGFKNLVDFIIDDEDKQEEFQFFPYPKTEMMCIKES